MNNISKLVTPRQAEEEAVLWLSKMDRGLSTVERKELSCWAQSSELNKNTLLSVAQTWDQMDRLQQLGELFPISPNSSDQSWFSRYFPLMGGLSFAAIACMLVILVKPFDLSLIDKNVTAEALYSLSYETAVGEYSTVNLPDSSAITLNTNTKVEVLFSDSERKLRLIRGEAHFDVAHDQSRPFLVAVGNNEVRAVGTAFNIELLKQGVMEVIVSDGEIAVRQSEMPVLIDELNVEMVASDVSYSVKKGERILVKDINEPAVVEEVTETELSDELLWQKGKLVFRGEELKSALEEVERYTKVRIEISGDSIGQTRIAGLFQAGDVEGLLASLEKNFDIKHQWLQPDYIVLH